MTIILQQVKGTETYSVGKFWQDVLYSLKTEIEYPSDCLGLHCGLMKMYKLKKLKLF